MSLLDDLDDLVDAALVYHPLAAFLGLFAVAVLIPVVILEVLSLLLGF